MPSLSVAKPSMVVKIDQPRKVRFNWSSACRFEEVYGKSIPEALQTAVGVRLITHLVWAGLIHEEPSLTVKDTERRIQSYLNADGDINALATEMIKALVESGVIGRPAKAPEEAPEEGAQSDPTPATPESL